MAANPRVFPQSDVESPDGMTLRDYFAAAAMQGYLATFVEHAHPASFDGGEGVAAYSYKLADAMLTEREK